MEMLWYWLNWRLLNTQYRGKCQEKENERELKMTIWFSLFLHIPVLPVVQYVCNQWSLLRIVTSGNSQKKVGNKMRKRDF